MKREAEVRVKELLISNAIHLIAETMTIDANKSVTVQ